MQIHKHSRSLDTNTTKRASSASEGILPNLPFKGFLMVFLLLSSLSLQAQIIWQEDFSYPDGTISGAGWAASPAGQCDANPGQWGVFGGQFVGNDAEGFNCCPCAGGGPNNCGDNTSLISFGPFDISNYCNVDLSFLFGASGSMECVTGCGSPPPIGCVGNGHDQAVFSYSLDGALPVQFGYYCGSMLCSGGPSVVGINGSTFSFTIAMGNQAVSESYFFDNMLLQGTLRPTPVANYNDPICNGQTLFLTETGGTGSTWSWSGPGFSSMSQNPSITNVGPANAGVYSVTVTSGPGCTAETSVNVVIGSGTSVSLGPDQSVCQNDPAILLDAGPGFTNYSWSPMGSGQTVTISTGTPLPTTQYSVTVTDMGGCTAESSVFVTVDAVPMITGPLGNQSTCETSFVLPPITGVNLSGNQSYYTAPGGPGPGNLPFAPGTIWIYTPPINVVSFFIYDANGNCSDEEAFSITFSPSPVINNPGNQEACNSYILPPITGLNLTGNESYFDGPGGTGTSYPPGTPITSTTVLFIYDAAGNCTDEESFLVTINLDPIITNPGNQSACDSYLLLPITGTNLSGNENYYDGPSGTGTTYPPGTVITSTTTLFIYDANGNCTDEEFFQITITPSPNLDPLGSYEGCGSYMLPAITGTNLSGNESYYDGPGGTGTTFLPGTIINNSTTLFIYDIVGTCFDEEVVSITINLTPSIDNPGNQDVCDNYMLPVITGTNLSGSEGYFDSPGGTGISYLPGTIITSNSTIFIYDANGTCTDEEVFSITISPTPNITNPGNQTVCDSYTLPAIDGINLSGSEGYYDNFSGGGTPYFPGDVINTSTVLYIYDQIGSCSDEESFSITIEPTPDITNPGDQTVCDSYTLPAITGTNLTGNEGYFGAPSGGGTVYTPGDNITSDITIYLYDVSGNCSDEDTMSITIAPTPVITNPGDQTICDNYTLPTITGTNLSGNQAYFDAPTGGGTQYNAGDNISSNIVLYIYDVAGSCSDEVSFAITVAPTPAIDNLSDQTVCDSYILPAITGTNLTGNEGYFDASNGGGTAYAAGDNITSNTTLYLYDVAGNCSDEDTINITIAPTPVITNPGDQNVCDNYTLPTITGTNLSGSQGYFSAPNGGGTTYIAGNNISANTTLYIYDAAGNCTDEESFTITIAPTPVITNPGDLTVCDSHTLPTITGSNLTGSQGYFSAPNGGGTTYIAGDNISSTTLLYIYDAAGNCTDEVSFTITVNDQPEAGTNNSVTVCEGNMLDLATALVGADGGGSFNDDDATGALSGSLFNTNGLAGSSYDFTYSLTGLAPCVGDQATITVTVATAVTAGLDNAAMVCAGTSVDLIGVLSGGDLGGSFNDDNGSGGLTGSMLNTNGLSGSYDFTYTVGDGIVCPIDDAVLSITVQPAPAIAAVSDEDVCDNFTLAAISGNNLSSNVAYFTAPNGGGTQYLPGQMISSTTTLYIYDDNAGCTDETSFNITITPSPVIAPFSPISECGNYVLQTISGSNLSSNVAYFTAANGGGTQYLPGQSISSSITLYAFDSNGNCNDEEGLSITITPGPALTPLADQEVCDSYVLPAIAGSNLSGNEAYFDAPAGGGTTYNPGDNISSSTTLYIYDANGNCTNEISFVITINNQPDAGLDNAVTVCEGSMLDLTTALTGADGGGSFTDVGGTGALSGSTFNTSGLAGSSYNFTYNLTATAPCIADEAMITVTVANAVTAGADNNATVCAGEMLDLISVLSGGDLGGSFNDDDGSGGLAGNMLNTNGLSGSYNFTYTVGDGIVCPEDRAQLTIDIQVAPAIGAVGDENVCGTYTLPAISGSNLSGNEAYYDTPAGGGTIYNPGDNINSTTTLYIYDANGSCTDETSFLITINNQPDAGSDNAVTVCEGSTLDLMTALTGADGGGSFTDVNGTGALSGSSFNTSGLAGSSYNFTYNLTATAPCVADEATITVTVANAVTAGADNNATVCAGETLDLISILSGGDLGGSFNDDNGSGGLTGNMLNTTGLSGNYNFTYTVGDGVVCPEDRAQLTISVEATPAITAPASIADCGSYILPTISGSNLSGNEAYYTATNGGGTQYLPGQSITSSSILYLYDSSNNGCNDEQTLDITINTQPEAGLDNTVSVCVGSQVDLTTALSGADAGGTFNDNGSTGALSGSIFNTSGLSSGSYTFTYALTATSPCQPDDALITVNIVNAVTAGNDNADVVCEGQQIDLTSLLDGGDLGGNFNDDNGSGGLTGNMLNTTGLSGNYNFTYTVGDGVVCPEDQSVISINIELTPVLDATTPITDCGTVTLPAISGSNLTAGVAYYSGTNGTGTQYAPGDPITSSTLLYIYDSNNGCSAEVTLDITVTPGPSLAPIADVTDCGNYTLPAIIGNDLSGNEAYYTATNGGGTQYLPGQSINSSTILYVYDDNNGCDVETSLNITINTPPEAGADNTISVCLGATFDLTTALSGADAGGVFSDDDATGALSGNTLNTSGLSSGSYRFTYQLTGSLPCPDDQALITVNVVNAVTAGNDNMDQVCEGQSLDLLSLLIGGDLGGTFTDDNGSGGLTSNMLNTTGLSGSYNFTYTVGDGVICPIDQAVLTVEIQAQPVLTAIADQEVCDSYTLPTINGSSLTANAAYFDGTGGSGTTYQPGDIISNSTTLYAYDANSNCAAEVPFVITINTAPTIGTPSFDCDDIANTYTVSFSISGGDASTYSVSGNTGSLSGSLFTSDPIASGDPYSFSVDDIKACGPELIDGLHNCACTGTDAGMLSPASLRVCETSTAVFNSTNTSLNTDDELLFVLHDGDLNTIGTVLLGSTTPAFNYISTLNYGQTYYIHALAGNSNGGGGIDPADPCFSQSEGIEIIFDPEITGSLSGDAAICQGEGTVLTFQLSGGTSFDVEYGSPGNSFTLTGITDGHQETVSPTVTTTYGLLSVTVANSACSLIQPANAVTVQVSDLSVQAGVNSDFGGFATSCSSSADGEAGVLVSNGVAPFTYLWSDGTMGAIAQNLVAAGYTVTVTDAAGCTAESNIQLTAPEAIVMDVMTMEPSCFDSQDGSIIINSVSGGAMPLEYSLDGQLFSPLQNFPDTLTALGAGSYELTIQDVNDCAEVSLVNVSAPAPLVVALGDDVQIHQGDSVDLHANVNFIPVDITWITDAGLSCFNCLDPIVRPIEDASLSIFLTDEDGCTATDDINIQVLKVRNVYIPSAFTPNGDGINEFFEVYPGPNAAMVKSFRVYNRWGDQVFGSGPFIPGTAGKGWNGYFKGKLMDPAVFVYVAEIEFIDGALRTYKGDVTLLR